MEMTIDIKYNPLDLRMVTIEGETKGDSQGKADSLSMMADIDVKYNPVDLRMVTLKGGKVKEDAPSMMADVDVKYNPVDMRMVTIEGGTKGSSQGKEDAPSTMADIDVKQELMDPSLGEEMQVPVKEEPVDMSAETNSRRAAKREFPSESVFIKTEGADGDVEVDKADGWHARGNEGELDNGDPLLIDPDLMKSEVKTKAESKPCLFQPSAVDSDAEAGTKDPWRTGAKQERLDNIGDPLYIDPDLIKKEVQMKAASKACLLQPSVSVYPCTACTLGFTSFQYLQRHEKFCLRLKALPSVEQPLPLLKTEVAAKANPKRVAREEASPRPARRVGAREESRTLALAEASPDPPPGGETPLPPPAHRLPFPCDRCASSFASRRQITRHRRIHSGKRPHVCPVCRASFIDKCGLVTHSRMHSGDRPFVCKRCGASFTTNSNLSKHRRLHKGDVLYPCGLCDARFADRASLAEHRRCHGERGRHVCDVCPASFAVEENLVAHGKMHRAAT